MALTDGERAVEGILGGAWWSHRTSPEERKRAYEWANKIRSKSARQMPDRAFMRQYFGATDADMDQMEEAGIAVFGD